MEIGGTEAGEAGSRRRHDACEYFSQTNNAYGISRSGDNLMSLVPAHMSSSHFPMTSSTKPMNSSHFLMKSLSTFSYRDGYSG